MRKQAAFQLNSAEFGRRLERFCELLPKPFDLITSVPDASLRILAFYALQLAEGSLESGDEPAEVEEVFAWIRSGAHSAKLGRKNPSFTFYFRVALQGLCTGYLGTQYYYLGELFELRVDAAELLERTRSGSTTHLAVLLPGQLDLFLTNLMHRVKNHESRRKPRHGFDQQKFSDALLYTVSYGAIVWQHAESIWLGRGVSYRGAKTVFLSYSTKDRAKIKIFDAELRAVGLDTWLDEKSIRFGEDILDAVSGGIVESADYLLIFLSEASVSSEWVKLETRIAYARQLKLDRTFVIPVLISDCIIPAHLKIKKYADARKNVRKSAKNVAQSILDYVKDLPLFT